MSVAAITGQVLEGLVNQKQLGLVVAELDGRIVYSNEAAWQSLQTTCNEINAVGLWGRLKGVKKEEILAQLESEGVVSWAWSEGPNSKELLFTAVRETSGAIGGVIAFVLAPAAHDVTSCADLDVGIEQLEAIGTATAKLGHDFNNLLGSIRGCVDLIKIKLRKEFPDGVPVKRQIKLIERSVEKAVELTRKMRSFTRQGEMETTPTRLGAVLESFYGTVVQVSSSNVHFDLNVYADPLVEINEFQVVQMLVSLCLNSMEAMEDLDEAYLILMLNQVQIAEEADVDVPAGKYAHLTVMDHGVGMSSETKQKAFQPFFSTKYGGIGKGLGLDLAMAKATMEKHNGYISVESLENAGTIVHMYFPLVE